MWYSKLCSDEEFSVNEEHEDIEAAIDCSFALVSSSSKLACVNRIEGLPLGMEYDLNDGMETFLRLVGEVIY